MTPCGQIKPARHAVLQLRQAGGGAGLIRRVAATARIDPRPVTRGSEEPDPFFFLFEGAPKRTEPCEEGSGEGQPTRAVKSRVKPERSIHLLTTASSGRGSVSNCSRKQFTLDELIQRYEVLVRLRRMLGSDDFDRLAPREISAMLRIARSTMRIRVP